MRHTIPNDPRGLHDFLPEQTFGLENQTDLVTGSARGIGLAIALAMGKAGARIVINDVRTETCEDAVQQLQAQGITARALSLDVADAAAVQQAQQQLKVENSR